MSAIASLTTSPANAAQYKNERLTVYINYRYKKAVHRQAYITSRKQNSSTYASSFTSAKASADSKLKSIFDLQDTYQNPVIEKADFRNNKFLQAGFTQYGYAISPTDKVVPAKTQSVNLSQPTINFSYAAVNSNTLIQDSRYSDENFFKFYNGNLAEVTNRDGLTTSYIWGYTNTLPIVKAAGIDYATLKTAYDAVGGNLSTIKAQASLSKALVNTYVHTPLLGIITESDPNNKTINYDYDAIGRLKNIKDYQGNIVKNFQYNYAGGCGNNCVVLPMQTFMSYNTPSYPVGVFNSSKQYIGIANTPAEYVTLWNSNAANQAIGVLGTNADSLHFNLTFAANAAVPPVVYGLRYFQWDTYSPVNVRIATDTSTFIDWGDGNRQLVTLPRQQMREGIAYYHTNNDFMYYAIWLNHTYANSQPRTITVFHNETTEFVALTNDGINDAAGQDANIRGYYPEKLKGISLDQIPNSSDMGIKNFDKLTEIVNIHYRNFGTNTFRHNNYHTINHLHKMKWLKIVTRNGNEIFSDMATNFPNLVYVEFSDFKPDITGAWGSSGGFPNLHVLAVETSNTSTGSVTLTPAEIDAVIIRQAAVGVSNKRVYWFFTNVHKNG